MNMSDGSVNSVTPIEKRRGRSTIGLVITDTNEVWEQHPWQGVEEAAREHDVNLLVFSGGALKAEYHFGLYANVIYDLMTPECVDGFVIGGPFNAHVGPEVARDFCKRHHPLPVVTAEFDISGFPGVLLDDYQSMCQVITHLIEVHGCRRIGYLGEPLSNHPGFRERYRAYVETLQAYDLPFDPNLVYSRMDEGEAGLSDWIRERISSIDALTGQEDNHILSALRALQSLDVCVPGDVAVAGFNDLMESRVAIPPLTTMRPPFYGLGQRAAEILLAFLAGEQVPEQESLVGQLIIRRSCGCADPLVARVAAGPVERANEPLQAAWAARREEILAEMVQAVGGAAVRVDPDWPDRLLDAFVAAVMSRSSESPDLFLRELYGVLCQTMLAGDDLLSGSGQGPEAWHGVISVLYRHAWPYLDDEALLRGEDLGQQVRVMIAATARRAQAYRALQTERRGQMLYEAGEALITTFDVGELMDVLAVQLPRLGIPSCYLSLYEDPQPYEYPQSASEWSWLVLAYSAAGGRIDLGSHRRRFRSRELIPEGMWPQERRYSFLVEPLHFREHQLGFALFEAGLREGSIYSILRAQISSALHGALLLEGRRQAGAALEKAYAEVEQQVRERTAELERENAERERAQEENLRLQQEVIEAQRQALRELSTPIIPVMDLPRGGSVIVVPLVGNVDNMRACDITRQLLVGIREHRAKVVILDVTGVPVVDTGVADHLNKTIQAARLKGARTIVTGISDAVAETIADLGIDWSGITMLGDLESGLRAVREANMDNQTGLRDQPAA